jgi:SpoVK/Ycf46/Vps4 family AAA+-type ATPase
MGAYVVLKVLVVILASVAAFGPHFTSSKVTSFRSISVRALVALSDPYTPHIDVSPYALHVDVETVDDIMSSTEEVVLIDDEIDTRQRDELLATHVGGLGTEIEAITRRILLSRSLPQQVVDAYGQQHVRGVLLHGPPGCGKTLIARHLASLLGAAVVKVVNGPEVFDKYVGEAERNVRELFAEADKAWDLHGGQAPLHVIVLDELDAIAKARNGGSSSSDGSSVRDSVVNQLLAKLDGVQSRSNVLVVGLTNRKDMIDPALLRPGRLEVHLEVNVPDAEGRRQILDIHTRELRRAGILCEEEYSDGGLADSIVTATPEYTGADIAGLVRSAASFSMQRLSASSSSLSAQDVHTVQQQQRRRGPRISLQWAGASIDFASPATARNNRYVRDAAALRQVRSEEQNRVMVKSLLDEASVTREDFKAALDELGRERKGCHDNSSKSWLSRLLSIRHRR